jgi:MinD superfamily P-loop ATPase
VFDPTLCVSCDSCQAFCRSRGVLISDRNRKFGNE